MYTIYEITRQLNEAIESGDWETIKDIRDLLEQRDTIFIEWSIDDVIGTGEEMGVTITPEQAREILSEIEDHHDASYGITWETIRTTIQLSEAISWER